VELSFFAQNELIVFRLGGQDRPCPLLKELVAAGHLGRKSGRGVFSY
jgi:3-hydroxyacyl-CoA dehydrogenase